MKKQFYIFLVALGVVISSCTEKIDLDLNTLENRRVVIDAWLTNEPKEHEVKLSYTVDFFDEEAPETISGAVVTLTDGTTTETLTEQTSGVYVTTPNYAGEIGKKYTLKIQVDDVTYTAVSYLDTVMQVDSIAYSKKNDFGFDLKEGDTGLQLYRLLMTGKEIEGRGNYYLIKTYRNNILDSDTISELAMFDDEFYDGFQYNLASYDYVEANVGDSIRSELCSVSRQVYEVYIAMMSETFRGGLFDSPPANVPSSFDNGALGVFATSSVSKKTIVIND